MAELNISPEPILEITISVVFFIILIYARTRTQSRGITSFNYFLLSWTFGGLMLLLEASSNIFLNRVLNICSNLLTFYWALMFLISLNYTEREHYYSFSLIILVILGTLFHVSAFLPGAVDIVTGGGFPTIGWFGYHA